MTDFHKRCAVKYRLFGWTWRQVYLGLKQRQEFEGTEQELKQWTRTQEYSDLRIDALCALDNWANQTNAEHEGAWNE